jgi:DNA-binding response OmpR family regulator
MQRILVVEGFDVRIVTDGRAAVDGFAEYGPDLVILDLMLPGLDGLEVCRRIQADRPVPVLMLTARDDETDLLVGLAVGADDYLTKPFSMRELTARVRTLLRRVEHAAALAATPACGLVRLGRLQIDQAARKVTVDGAPVHLTPIEYELLGSLARAPGTVLTRAVLLEQVWDWGDGSGTRVVDSHVKALRRKLGSDLIRTVHGVGYALQITS